MSKFEIKEPVKVITKFYKWQRRFRLPDECLFYGETADGKEYLILWHGTVSRVPKKDVYKIQKERP